MFDIGGAGDVEYLFPAGNVDRATLFQSTRRIFQPTSACKMELTGAPGIVPGFTMAVSKEEVDAHVHTQ